MTKGMVLYPKKAYTCILEEAMYDKQKKETNNGSIVFYNKFKWNSEISDTSY